MLELTREQIGRLGFVDEPVFHPLEAYAAVRDRYVEQVAGLPGVVSVYQMGSVGAPGISDLDLVVVLDGPGPFAPARALSTDPLGRDGRYVFMHTGAMVIDADSFQELNLLIYAAHLKRVHGAELSIRELSERDARLASRAILIDASIHLLHQLVRTLVSRTVYVRRILMAISAVSHTREVARRAGLSETGRSADYLERALRLKNGWFEHPDREELVRLLVEGIEVVLDILVELERELERSGEIRVTERSCDVLAVVRQSFNAFTLYAPDPRSVLAGGVDALGRRGLHLKLGHRYMNATLSVVPLPLSLLLHVWCYMQGESLLSWALRDLVSLSPERIRSIGEIDAHYAAVMARRVDLWSDSLGFLAKHGLLEFDVMPFPGSQQVYSRGFGLTGALKRLGQNVLTPSIHLAFRAALLPRLRRLALAGSAG